MRSITLQETMPRFFSLLLMLLLTLTPFFAYGQIYLQKDINVYVDETFIIAPWSNASYKFPNYKCFSTNITRYSDNSAFNTVLRSSTKVANVPDYNNMTMTGNIRTWNVTALKAGSYTIIGLAQCRKRVGTSLYDGICYITYNVSVSEKPIVKSIDIPQNLNLKIGDRYTFSPIIYETGATTTLTWSSSNKNIATITNNGALTAVGIGNSTITCKASNGVLAKCNVEVSPIYASNISLNYDEYELMAGEKVLLKATIKPDNCSNKDVAWKSSNENIAIVNSIGTVVGITEGYCNISASTTDGSNKSVSCIMHVYKPKIPIESIALNINSASMKVGDTLSLKATILPSNATDTILTWISSNPNVVTVENGNVIAIDNGEVVVIAMANDDSGKLASCDIKVGIGLGIKNNILENNSSVIEVYDLTGRKVHKTNSGINIIRFANGKFKKIIKSK